MAMASTKETIDGEAHRDGFWRSSGRCTLLCWFYSFFFFGNIFLCWIERV